MPGEAPPPPNQALGETRRRLARMERLLRWAQLPSGLLVLPGLALPVFIAFDALIVAGGFGRFPFGERFSAATPEDARELAFLVSGLFAVAMLALAVQTALWLRTRALRADLTALDRATPRRQRQFVLLLRSFFIDRSLTAESRTLGIGDEVSIGSRETLHRRLELAFAGRLGVEWIGDERWFQVMNVALKTPDERWKTDFMRLVDDAELVFLSPVVLGDGGALDEIEHVAQAPELFEKTVLIAPTNHTVLLARRRGAGLAPSVRSLWRRSQTIIAERTGWRPPGYPGRSAVFLPGAPDAPIFGVSGRSWDQLGSLELLFVEGRTRRSLLREAVGFGAALSLRWVVFGVALAGLASGLLQVAEAPDWVWFTVGGAFFWGWLRTWWIYCGQFALRPGGRLLLALTPAPILGIWWTALFAVVGPIWSQFRRPLDPETGLMQPLDFIATTGVLILSLLIIASLVGGLCLALLHRPATWRR